MSEITKGLVVPKTLNPDSPKNKKNQADVLAYLTDAAGSGMTITNIAEAVGIKLSTTRFALAVLFNRGLIMREREGTSYFYYALVNDAKPAVNE